VADNAGQTIDVDRKTLVASFRTPKTHPGSPTKNESSQATSISNEHTATFRLTFLTQ
jgi:hypothetical protein